MSNIKLKPINSYGGQLDCICEWRNDERVRPYLRTTLDNYLDNQDGWINSIIKRDDCFYYYIMDEELKGYCALENIHWQNRTAEISLLINPDKHNKGIGKETVIQLLDIGFNRFNLNLIWGDVYGHNPAKEFWFKLGFSKDGELRYRKYYNDVYYSSIIFSMTKEEYLCEGVSK